MRRISTGTRYVADGDRILVKLDIDIERIYVSDAQFSIRVESGDIGGWTGETEILENA